MVLGDLRPDRSINAIKTSNCNLWASKAERSQMVDRKTTSLYRRSKRTSAMTVRQQGRRADRSSIASAGLATALTKFRTHCDHAQDFFGDQGCEKRATRRALSTMDVADPGLRPLEGAPKTSFDGVHVAARLQLAAGIAAGRSDATERAHAASVRREARLVGGLARTLSRGVVSEWGAA